MKKARFQFGKVRTIHLQGYCFMFKFEDEETASKVLKTSPRKS